MRTFSLLLLGAISLLSSSAACGQEASPPPRSLEELEQQLQQTKDVGARYAIEGQILAAAPERIPEQLPKLLEAAAGFKAGQFYVANMLKPCAKEAVPMLIQLLEKEEFARSWIVQTGLVSILPVARPAVIELLEKHSSNVVRVRAAQVLAQDRAEDKTASVEALRKQLKNRHGEVRIDAALALLSLESDAKDAVAVLHSDYSLQSDRILQAAFRPTVPEIWREVLVLGLKNENRGLRAEAALALVALDGKWNAETHRHAIDGMYINDQQQYGIAVRSAGALGTYSGFQDQSIEQLERICGTSDSLPLQAAASAALLRLDPSQAELRLPAVLAAVIRSGNSMTRNDHLLVIGELGERARFAEPTLSKLLRDEGTRGRLLLALVYLRLKPADPKLALEILREGLQGKSDGGSRFGLTQFRQEIDGLEPLFPDLLAALDAPNLFQQRMALQLLQSSGPAAKALVPELAKRTLLEPVDKDLKELVKRLSETK